MEAKTLRQLSKKNYFKELENMKNLIAFMDRDRKPLIKQNLLIVKKLINNALKNIEDGNCEQATLADNITDAIIWLKKTRDI